MKMNIKQIVLFAMKLKSKRVFAVQIESNVTQSTS